MKQFLVFVRKEFYHVFRDRRTLLIMFGLPVVQIALFGFALTSEVRNARVLVLDRAADPLSSRLTGKLGASAYFSISQTNLADERLADEFRKGDIQAAVIIPPDFAEDLRQDGQVQIQVLTDGTDPNIAKTMLAYIQAIVSDFQRELPGGSVQPWRILTETRMLYNENLSGSLIFIPGVIALIMMIVCTALTSVSIVKEKETGTMEVLLVSPFRPVMVLFSKAIPYLVLSLANFVLILFLSVYALHVTIQGNLFLLFGETAIFIITCLSLGLLISNATNSQQTALLMSIVGIMLPTLIFTGFMFPIENMPKVFRIISNIVPSRWYFIIIKAVMLKGLGFSYVWKETLVLTLMTLFLLGISLKKFSVRLS